MQKHSVILTSVLYSTIALATIPSDIVFNKCEKPLSKILAMPSLTNKNLADLFANESYSQHKKTHELRQITTWELKREILEIIVSSTNLNNHTTRDAQILHQLSGSLICSSCPKETIKIWQQIEKEYCYTPHITLDSDTITKLYRKTQAYIKQNLPDLIRKSHEFYVSKHGPLFHDKRQTYQKTVRSLKDTVENGLSIRVDKEFIPLLKETFQSNPHAPLSDQLKNLRILTTNGLKDSKVSFLCHDLFDHCWLFNKLKQLGFINKYKSFFDKVGNPHLWDIFSREGELVASIGFEYRLYLASNDYKPLFDIVFIKENLSHSPSNENQKRALALLSEKNMPERFYHGLPIIYSGIIIELMEQRRKHGFIKILDANQTDEHLFSAFDPDYTALIVEACALLFMQEHNVLETLNSIAILTEEYLLQVAQNKTDQPFLITLKDIEAYKNKTRWFKNNPGFASTRQILSKKRNNSMQSEYEIKFFVDRNSIKKTLVSNKALLTQPRRLMKRQTFHFENEPNKWARIRDEGDKITLTIKKIDDNKTIDGVKEIEVVVNDFKKSCALLKEMELITRSYQENYRETWQYENCIITIDEWPGLDPFIEIESKSKEAVYRAAEKLGMNPSNGFYGSIDLLYQKQLKIDPHKFNTLDSLTFENAHVVLETIK